MSIRVDPTFLKEIKKYGAFDISACFNCGNCTAVCPLSEGRDNFPRKMIRYSQLGLRDRLIASKEFWLCYYCGECSDTCPRLAEPGEFMASARRYLISSFDLSGISRLLYTSKIFTAIFMIILSGLFSLVLLYDKGAMELATPAMFQFITFEIIHGLGLAVIAAAVIIALVGVLRMIKVMKGSLEYAQTEEKTDQKSSPLISRLIPAVKNVAAELAVLKRYRDCEEEPKPPWYISHWFIHWTIMWGFIGLLVATSLDYLLMMVADKIPAQPDHLWYPTRMLGNVAGLVLMYGTSLAIIYRFTKPDKYYSHSLLSDWLFLWLLFLEGLTGFIVELAIYLPTGTIWGYVIFFVHVVIGMEIVVLLPFTKFAHAVYRPLALLIYNLSNSIENPK